ncbi:MAG: RAMP superfamily CRISPR-associated protein [Bacteroidales bacterium]
MRKQIRNEFRLELSLTIAEGSKLLIAEEREKNKPDSPAVGVKSNGDFYLPGSSLKGVLRSMAEYISKFLSDGSGVCHPFDTINDPNPSCGERFNAREKKGPLMIGQRYVDACPVCQLFGHTFEAGRLRVTDFKRLVGKEYPLEKTIQSHAPIDRMSGGVNSTNLPVKKLFKVEYLTQATFSGEIIIENFSLWQIGLLGFLLQDLQDGFIQIGHKQTTNTGKMCIHQAKGIARHLGIQPYSNTLPGLIIQFDLDQRKYDIHEESIPIPDMTWKSKDFWWQAEFENKNALDVLWATTRPKANQYLKQFRFQAPMTLENLREANHPLEVKA